MTKAFKIKPWQKAISDAYSGGEFGYVAEVASQTEFDVMLELTGDTLFSFIMRECDPREDCTSKDLAQHRLCTIMEDIRRVLGALA